MKYILFFCLLLLSAVAFAQTGFDLTQFSDSTKYGWSNLDERIIYRDDLISRQKLLHIYEMDSQSLRANIFKSAIMPGWGQFSTNHNTRGQAILAAELILAGTSLYFYDKSMDYYRKYENATQIDEIEQYYKKSQQPYQYSMIFLGLASIVWAYNLFDVIQATESFNANTWERIQSDYSNRSLSVSPTGIEVRF